MKALPIKYFSLCQLLIVQNVELICACLNAGMLSLKESYLFDFIVCEKEWMSELLSCYWRIAVIGMYLSLDSSRLFRQTWHSTTSTISSALQLFCDLIFAITQTAHLVQLLVYRFYNIPSRHHPFESPDFFTL